MQYLLFIGTGALLIGSLVKNLRNFTDNLRVYVTIGSLPKLAKGDLQLPVRVRIDNPVTQAFKVTELFITAYKKTPQGATYLASTSPLSQPFIIKPSATTEFQIVVRLPVQDAILEAFNTLTNSSGFTTDNYILKGYLRADGVRIPIDTTTQSQLPR